MINDGDQCLVCGLMNNAEKEKDAGEARNMTQFLIRIGHVTGGGSYRNQPISTGLRNCHRPRQYLHRPRVSFSREIQVRVFL
jgi:hypothetical protein